MARRHRPPFVCPACNQRRPASEAVPWEVVRAPIRAIVEEQHPRVGEPTVICRACLNNARAGYVEDVLEAERGSLSRVEHDVVDSFRDFDLMSANLNAEFDQRLTLGERLSDRLARFGGSWRFIIIFGGILLVWIALNSIQLLHRPFDPYPFILLNLVLSCLAALQAPVIMMSQNRLEAKDRLRAEHDYRVNLKAELEVRHLDEKIDLLVAEQWRRLLEIQQIQVELMKELSERLPKAGPAAS